MNCVSHLINSARVAFKDRSVECYTCGTPQPISHIMHDVKRYHYIKDVSYIRALCDDGLVRYFNPKGIEIRDKYSQNRGSDENKRKRGQL